MSEPIRSMTSARRSRVRLAVAAVVVSALALSSLRDTVRPEAGSDSNAAASQARLRFEQLCRSAGDERRNVAVAADAREGLAWLTPLLRLAGSGLSDRYRQDDAYDSGCTFDDCIARLLRVSFGASSNPNEAARHVSGFAYVEALDPRDLGLYRYSAGIGVARWRDAREIEQLLRATGEEPGPAVYDFIVQREAIEAYGARYGIRWSDTSALDDRSLGIAASELDVVDLQSGELVGRRTGFSLSSGAGPRTTCPSLTAAAPGTADRDFILTVLR